MPLIVIDGQDRVGKSGLVKEICREAPKDMVVMPFGNKAPSLKVPLKERRALAIKTVTEQYRLAKKKDWLVVVDRGHYSEVVYGDLYRGESIGGGFEAYERILLWELIGVQKIAAILHVPPEILITRDDGDSTWTHEGLPAIRREAEYFHRLRLATKFPIIKTDYTAENLLKQLEGQLCW